jgi:hypothetical protein
VAVVVFRRFRLRFVARYASRARGSRDHNVQSMLRCRHLTATALGVAGLGAYVLAVRGSLTLDLGVGRSLRPLGPLYQHIAAPREVVFEVIAGPYLGRTPRALKRKLRVLERSEDMVLAAHFTPVGPLVATTVETVRFERPERIHFRLVRGPVPYAAEVFQLDDADGGTMLRYSGELGADLWVLGHLWSAATARVWQTTVRRSLEGIAAESERRASSTQRTPDMS